MMYGPQLQVPGATMLLSVAFSSWAVYVLLRQFYRSFMRVYPPGPPAKPLIGNIFSFTSQGSWISLNQLKEKFGNIIYFHGLGNHIVALNSLQVINDLLDKRAIVYSSRPVLTVVCELMGAGQSTNFLQYGKEWREHRRLTHAALNPAAVKKYHAIQEDMSALLNVALLDSPEDFFAHVRLTAGRIILAVTYGLSVENADNKYITQAEETLDIVTRGAVPGAFICDFFPFLKYLPSWVPFQKEAAHGKEMIERLMTMPFEHVKRSMADGTAPPSLARELLLTTVEEDPLFESVYEHRVKWTTGSMYGAGGETTHATVVVFIMAMALNPDKQALAQAEIDRVVGKERLPVIADRPDLPYLVALIKETMRWHPITPLSIPRQTTEDDTYEGYLIPKGTIVMPNVWSIAFEANEKYDPKAFIPERFLDPTDFTPDPATWAFGFGRRICPGKSLAENSLFAILSGILAAFDILPPADSVIEQKFELGLLSSPLPFKCRIIPRSSAAAELVRRRASSATV